MFSGKKKLDCKKPKPPNITRKLQRMALPFQMGKGSSFWRENSSEVFLFHSQTHFSFFLHKSSLRKFLTFAMVGDELLKDKLLIIGKKVK